MKKGLTASVAGFGLIAFAGAVYAQQDGAGKADIPPAAVRAERDFPLAAAKAKTPGEAVFLARCQYCHEQMGMGTLTLAKRLGPQKALLANRTDMAPAYIHYVVRHGFGSMPAINRADVPDGELDLIVKFLTRNNPPAGKSSK